MNIYLLRFIVLSFFYVTSLTYNIHIHIAPVIYSYIESGSSAGTSPAFFRNLEVEVYDDVNITHVTHHRNGLNLSGNILLQNIQLA